MTSFNLTIVQLSGHPATPSGGNENTCVPALYAREKNADLHCFSASYFTFHPTPQITRQCRARIQTKASLVLKLIHVIYESEFHLVYCNNQENDNFNVSNKLDLFPSLYQVHQRHQRSAFSYFAGFPYHQGKIPPASGTGTSCRLPRVSRSLSSPTLPLRTLQGNGFLLKRNNTSIVNTQVEKANLHREKLQQLPALRSV